jgi:hypothetical protein
MAVSPNVGSADRLVRLVLGAGALIAAFAFLGAHEGSIVGIIAAVGGVVLIGTALMRFCPAYLPLGVSTCKTGGR